MKRTAPLFGSVLLWGIVSCATIFSPAKYAQAVVPTATPTPMFGQVTPNKFWAFGETGTVLANSNAETLLGVGTLPAGSLQTGRVWRILVSGEYSATGTPDLTLTLRMTNGLNSASVAQSQTLAATIGVSGAWSIEETVTVFTLGSTTGTANQSGFKFLFSTGTTLPSTSTTIGVNFKLPTRFAVTAQFSAASNDNAIFITNAAFFPGQ